MSRETVVRHWCDGDHDEKVEARSTYTVSLDQLAPVEVDLCSVHSGILLDVKVLLNRGVEVAPKTGRKKWRPAPGGPFSCPLCGHEVARKESLRKHGVKKHGMTMAQMREAAGLPPALPGRRSKPAAPEQAAEGPDGDAGEQVADAEEAEGVNAGLQ